MRLAQTGNRQQAIFESRSHAARSNRQQATGNFRESLACGSLEQATGNSESAPMRRAEASAQALAFALAGCSNASAQDRRQLAGLVQDASYVA